MANRIWSWLMGRGIVHEPDDFRADNPPSNPALLAFLEKEFAASKCDMRHLFRVILNSRGLPALLDPRAGYAGSCGAVCTLPHAATGGGGAR
jgi:hypothetical protein